MRAHKFHKCNVDGCNVCNGGLNWCIVCGQAEAELEDECPGDRRAADPCLCTNLDAALCDGNGRLPSGACGCACHGAWATCNPTYGRSALALAHGLSHLASGNTDAATAHMGHAEALLALASTEDLLAEALRVGLEECERLREHVKSGAMVSMVMLRRVRDALRAFGVADCADPLAALDAAAAEAVDTSRALREGAAKEVDAHNAIVGRLAKAWDECDAMRAERDRARAEGRAAGLREAMAIAVAEEDVHAKRAGRRGLAYEDVQRAQARRFEAEMIGDRIKAALEVSRG